MRRNPNDEYRYNNESTIRIIVSANRDRYTNLQLDNFYLDIGGVFTPAAKEEYESNVRAEKAAAKQALETQRNITKEDALIPGLWLKEVDPIIEVPIISPSQVWDPNNTLSVDARWLWDTRRYFIKPNASEIEITLSDPSRYATWVILANQTINIDKERQEYDAMPINVRDQKYKDKTLTNYQTAWWMNDFADASAKAQDEINNKDYVTEEELRGATWSDISLQNDDAPKQAPPNIAAGRVFWDTRRFTAPQAAIYLSTSNDGKEEEKKKEEEPPDVDCIHFIKEIDYLSPSSIVDGVSNFASCEVTKIENKLDMIIKAVGDKTGINSLADLYDKGMTTLEIILFLLLTGGVVLGIAAWRSGVIGYAGRIATGAVFGPVAGAIPYYKTKKRLAIKNKTSVSEEFGKDIAIGAANPFALISKTIVENVPEDSLAAAPEGFTLADIAAAAA